MKEWMKERRKNLIKGWAKKDKTEKFKDEGRKSKEGIK